MRFPVVLIVVISISFLSSCKKGSDEDSETTMSDELSQNVGDVMAGIDEAGGSGGTIAFRGEVFGNPKRFFPGTAASLKSLIAKGSQLFLPQASASSCYANGFAACSSGSITRTFSDCTVGLLTFAGTVSLAWTGASAASCSLAAAGDSISRNPNFSITGPSGGTFAVAKVGTNGQVLTWQSGTGTAKVFSFANDGIRRTFTNSTGNLLYDFVTETTTPITVTGTLRSDRVMNGGVLKVTNNSNAVTCDMTPNNVSWSAGCTCASTGNWSGNCSDGTGLSLSISSCGTATLTVGSSVRTINFDRCAGS